MHRSQRPKAAAIDDVSGLTNEAMPAKIEAYQRVATGAGGTLHQPVRVIKAQGQRLFQEEVLASVENRQPDLGMELRRCTDRHQIDAGIVQQRAIISMASLYPSAIRNPGKAREIAVCQRDQLEARDLPPGRQMALFDHEAASDDGQP